MAPTSTASRSTSTRRHASAKHTQTQVPLGSLTQPGARSGASCRACGSERVTRLAMNLTDGSPVEFTSCHRCEHRTWVEQDSAAVLPVARVLDKTRKI
jgi:DNA-directed RNA polymerase subunit M/transcription elongation factor TFIIS